MYFKALDDAIAQYLRDERMTQAELAAKMGMAPNTFSWKRNGERNKEFKLSEAVCLCDIIGVALDEVFYRQRIEYGWPEEPAGDAGWGAA